MSDDFSFGDDRDAFPNVGGNDWVERLTGVPAPKGETFPQMIARLINPQKRDLRYKPQYTLPDLGMRIGRVGTPAITTEKTRNTTPFVAVRPERVAPNTVPYQKFPARPDFRGKNQERSNPRLGPDEEMAPMPTGEAKPKPRPPIHDVNADDEDTGPGSLAEAKRLFKGRPLQQAIYYTDPRTSRMERLGVGADTSRLNPDYISRIWEPKDMSGGERFIRGAYENAFKAKGGSIDGAKKIADEKRTPCHYGIINMAVGGRTDHIPMNVLEGSYVLPADIVSGLGEGNTLAGSKIIDNMFSTGPFGKKMKDFSIKVDYPTVHEFQYNKAASGGRQEAGNYKPVPIIAAGGEYVIHPDVVKKLGKGDITRGHEWLDNFVKNTRHHLVKTLKKLPGPKRD